MKYSLITDNSVWNNKVSVEQIDYSILLTHVFGEPIRAEQAFMYLFRRYGLPNTSSDDLKDLCAYSFHTKDRGVIVQWRIGEGDYHHHLCAFAEKKDFYEYRYRPIDDWHKRIQAAAEKDGLVYFGGNVPRYIYEIIEDGELAWIGNDLQKAAAAEIFKDYSDSDEEAWSKVFDRMRQNDREIEDKYKDVLPYPEIESQYEKPFCCQFKNQVEAGKQQHEWIMSLPEGHFLRRVYFAVMDLFENWKGYTYIRDVYFNMTCRGTIDNIKKSVGYTDYQSTLVSIRP